MADDLPIGIKAGASLNYERKDISHVVSYETDTAELCKPKLIKGLRRWIFFKKVVVFHYRGGHDYYIKDIR
jgi:hypothetical protein